jgi:Uma2 family endonuclease
VNRSSSFGLIDQAVTRYAQEIGVADPPRRRTGRPEWEEQSMSTIASMTPPTLPRPQAWIPSPLYRMTVDEYEAMVASGAFKGRNRFHLINGLLVARMTQNPPHAIAYTLCGDELDRVTPPGWHVRSALPVRLPGQISEPEPDHCIVRGVVRDYLGGHPGAGDIALVVEIADSSLDDDRQYAANLYGPAGIPVCWIVNVVDRQVEVYTGPGPAGYASRVDFKPGQAVPFVIGGQQIGQVAVNDVLP